MQHRQQNEDMEKKAENIKSALSFLRSEARKCGLLQTENSLSIAEIIINMETEK
ncbi:hypothetical protein KOEU_17830 [Komagataeibacter europaeus]|uniref:Uncharacterized protein n=1 Tax=Komagataeibacter europaeus TaxID=33995 RepID=A0A0M0EHS3_KOMEU|nr:hypothetical protein [Komagataeibacter europaeus]ARW16392.1 hypothetical protein S101446_01261 [Komagataeibacter europaeus]KON64813.1 hypothetical protein KOEU_17830 [Komagataeibacter europaeus]